jgi:hypothetical protein
MGSLLSPVVTRYTLPEQVNGGDLADAVVKAAKTLKNFQTDVSSYTAFDENTGRPYEVRRIIGIFPKQSWPSWLRNFFGQPSEHFGFAIDVAETYSALETNPFCMSPGENTFERHRDDYTALMKAVHFELGLSPPLLEQINPEAVPVSFFHNYVPFEDTLFGVRRISVEITKS